MEKEQKEPEAKDKKKTSYTYWVNNDPNFFGNVQNLPTGPTKIEPQNSSPAPVPLTSSTSSHSAWNSAGTWEERKIELRQVEDLIKEKLDKITGTNDGVFMVMELKKIEGEVITVISRGKTKLGFTLELEFLVREEPTEQNENTALLKISEFSDDGDFEVKK